MPKQATFDQLRRIYEDLEDRDDGDLDGLLAAAAREGRTDFYDEPWARDIDWECENGPATERLLQLAATAGAQDAGMSEGILTGLAGDAAGLPFWLGRVAPGVYRDAADRLVWLAERVVPAVIKDGAVDGDLRARLSEIVTGWLEDVRLHSDVLSRIRVYVAVEGSDWRGLLDADQVEFALDLLRHAAGLPEPHGDDDEHDEPGTDGQADVLTFDVEKAKAEAQELIAVLADARRDGAPADSDSAAGKAELMALLTTLLGEGWQDEPAPAAASAPVGVTDAEYAASMARFDWVEIRIPELKASGLDHKEAVLQAHLEYDRHQWAGTGP